MRTNSYFLAAIIVSSLQFHLAECLAEVSDQRMTPVVRAVRRAMPSVVNLSSEKQILSRTTWSNSNSQRVNGMGSGIIVDERGYILTNAHVVDKVTKLQATLSDGTTHPARTIGIDRRVDLALVKVSVNRPLPTIPLGISQDLMIGESVIAVGNAYGYENTVTRGVISALHRTVRLNDELTYFDLIQTDASINPGNSGGALVNIDGNLVGVNVAIRAGAQGISFAIPVDTVREIAAQLLKTAESGKVNHGLSYSNKIDADTGRVSLKVDRVAGPAAGSGIEPGDVITKIDSRKVSSGLDLERAMIAAKSGDQFAVQLRRGDETVNVKLKLGNPPLLARSPTEKIWQELGLRLSVVDAFEVRRHQPQLNGGMYVIDVRANSPAELSGVKTGDILLGLGKWETLNYDNVSFVLGQRKTESIDVLRAHVLRVGERYEMSLAF